MKKTPRSLTSFAAALLMPGLCFADDGAANPAEAGGETSAQAEARKRAPASNFLPIVRGRLPLIFVHAARFKPELTAMSTKDAASKLGTSVGKIFDIRKGRNFDYVNQAWKPTAEDVSAAQGWIAQVGAANAKGLTAVGDKALLQSVLDEYVKGGLATAAEAAASKPAKAPAATDGAAAPAKGKGKAAKTEATQAGASADALLG